MNDEMMDELREVELNIFREFTSVCTKLNIKYFLLDGSCLGAIRHKGFIPWDDDIDVGLYRPDYNKFINYAQDLLPQDIFLQTFVTDPEYLNNFAKLRSSNTTFLELSSRKLKINHGIFLDVFPLDGAGNSKNEGKRQLEKIKWYSRAISQMYVSTPKSCRDKIKMILKKILSFVFFPSISRCVEIRDKLYRKIDFENSSYIANYGGSWGEKEIVPKSFFGDGIKVEFEGMKVTVPKDYDAYLTHIYGDYMTLPPIEKRVTHHYSDIIDTRNTYKKYV